MNWYRIYVDKVFTDSGGGDHSRTVDMSADDPNAALEALELEADEQVNSIVELSEDPNG